MDFDNHHFVAFGVFIGLWLIFPEIKFSMIVLPIFLATAPDVDLKLKFGMKSHRNLLFHSLLFPLFITFFNETLLNYLIIFSFGLHCICDIRFKKVGGTYLQTYHVIDDIETPIQKVNRVIAVKSNKFGRMFKFQLRRGRKPTLPKGCEFDKSKFTELWDEAKEMYDNLLNRFEIPYFTIELPYYVKEHFSKEIVDFQNKVHELKAGYDMLVNKNTSSAQALKFLIEQYSNELDELNRYINFEVRTEAIVKKILAVLKGRENNDLTFVHFGEENTFIQIMKRLKELDVKSNAIFIQKSKVL